MISSTISSVALIASAPMLVRLWMHLSTSSSTIPSAEVTHLPSIERRAERRAVLTPDEIFRAQLGFAPSQIIPVRLAIIFLTEQNKAVVIDKGNHHIGEFVKVRITGSTSATLFGEEVKE